MVNVVVNGPSSWNTLVALDTLPRAEPHMVIANGHRLGLGGTSAAKALGLAQLGVPTTLRTVVGDDPDADRIRSALVSPLLTLIPEVVPGPSEHHLNLLAGARDAGCEIWCDIHDYDGVAEFHRPFIGAADVLVVSADRLADRRGFLSRVVAEGTSLAVGTDGARGALALSKGDGWLQVDAIPITEVADTNGAGDAFVVGLLASRLAGLALEEGLRWASAAGAICVQSMELVAPEMTRSAVQTLARSVGCAQLTG
jgi:sugar/nucleoside kinase (ribokinase family)